MLLLELKDQKQDIFKETYQDFDHVLSSALHSIWQKLHTFPGFIPVIASRKKEAIFSSYKLISFVLSCFPFNKIF